LREKLKTGRLYRIEGPACITVVEGELEVLGKRVGYREKIVVPKAKVTSFRVLRGGLVDIRLGEGAKIEEVEQPLTPPEWEEAAKRIINGRKPCKVIVIGNVDSGKTTFTVYLANQAVVAGLKTFVIDKDVGQSDIGAPTTIGLGMIETPVVSLAEIAPVDGFFVGVTSPSGVIHRVIIGATLLTLRALNEGADLVIINTSGWVTGRGARELKWNLILATAPDYIVALQRRGEVEHILRPISGFANVNIIRLPAPIGVRGRSREERRMLREANFKRELVGAKIRSFHRGQIGLMYGIYGSGVPLSGEERKEAEEILGEKVVYMEGANDGLLVVTEKEVKDLSKKVHRLREIFGKDVLVVPKGHENGLLVGLLDKTGKFLGVGVIKEIRYSEGIIRVLTNVTDDVGVIQFGQIKLNENGREIAKYDGWAL